MKRKIERYKQNFFDEVNQHQIFNADNGTFIAAGLLKIPEDHVSRGINTVCLYIVVPNKDGTDIELHRLSMTAREAEIISTELFCFAYPDDS